MKRKNRLPDILFWSVISAAFIGPGTITTAASAGASFGATLLWALVFSTIATMVLQETVARVTIATGKNLGHHIAESFKTRWIIPFGIWFAVVFGCAAYEAGNILGAVVGLEILTSAPAKASVVIITLAAFSLLASGKIDLIAKVLGIFVGVMGLSFTVLAFRTDVHLGQLVLGAFVPRMPSGSLLLIVALVGTTVVPYNLFLGSDLGKGQTIGEMRSGLYTAVILGGLISMAVLVSGTLLSGEMTFAGLAQAVEENMGHAGRWLLGTGLAAAGLTSAATAPLAAAIATQSVFKAAEPQIAKRQFHGTWLAVLLIGAVFSLLDLKPVSVIIAAQALNGMLLPLIALVLFSIGLRLERDFPQMKVTRGYQLLLLLIVGVVVFLGVNSFVNALAKAFDSSLLLGISQFVGLGAGALTLIGLAMQIRRSRS